MWLDCADNKAYKGTMQTNKGWTNQIQLKVRFENDQLLEREIICPACGGEAWKFEEGQGASSARLECLQCGKHLAEFASDAAMEVGLEEMWQMVQSYLQHRPNEN